MSGIAMKALPCDEQPCQPVYEGDPREREQALVEFDLQYLIKCLSEERNTSYKIIDRPDVKNRQSPQPDYLIEDCVTGKLVAIEHARFFESEESRKSEATFVKKVGFMFKWLRFPSPQELGQRLSDFVSKKLEKGQFKTFGHAERILLARNRYSGVRLQRFLEVEPYLKLPEPTCCDHFYLIVDNKLLEVF